MCGIFVVATKDSGFSLERFLAGLSLIRHRGPDGSGVGIVNSSQRRASTILEPTPERLQAEPIEGDLFLGHRRLAILDTSSRAAQPMTTPSGRYTIVWNGEIYNFRELSSSLSGATPLRSSGDTEVLLRAFEQWGSRCLDRLVGMFALAIYDHHERKLFCARDHFGIKPLYCFRRPGLVAVASEIKAFFGIEGFSLDVAREHVLEYLNFRSTAGRNTLWKGVEEVLPGHFLSIDLETLEVDEERWWRMSREDSSRRTDVVEEFTSRLEESVSLQMVSDVPLGTQLSGGLDSSTLSYLANSVTPGGVAGFTIGFQDPSVDESRHAARFASELGIEHHAQCLEVGEFVKNLVDATWHFDLPLNHPNSLGILMLSAFSKRWVKVLLSGEGADETLAGYPRRYHTARLLPVLRRYPRAAAAGLFASKVLPYTGRYGRRLSQLTGLSLEDALILDLAYGWFGRDGDSSALSRLLATPGFEVRRQLMRDNPFPAGLSAVQHYDTLTYLRELLVRQDKFSMASSIENRVPFLDHRLVQWVLSLPDACRLGPRKGKVILRKAMRGTLPSFLFSLPKKGFPIPLWKWFDLPEFAELRRSMCDESGVRDLLQDASVGVDAAGGTGRNGGGFEATWIELGLHLWLHAFSGAEVDRRMRAASKGLDH